MSFYCAFYGKRILPRARYAIACSRHRKLHISDSNSDQGRSVINNVIFLEINSPTNLSVACLRSCDRAQKPLNPRNTKKLRKKYKIAHPGLGPENQNWPILYFFRIFFVFSGPNPGWAILYFFSYFFCISGIQGFLGSVAAPQARNLSVYVILFCGDNRYHTNNAIAGITEHKPRSPYHAWQHQQRCPDSKKMVVGNGRTDP